METPLWTNLATIPTPEMTAGERRLSRVVLFVESLVKVPLFRCKRCGECVLCSTAFICPMNCPKQLRNGPCGGTREDGSCEVHPERKCVWYKIYLRSRFLHRVSLLYNINRAHNWNLEGTSAWLNLIRKRIDAPIVFVRDDRQRVKDIIGDDAATED